MKTHSVSWRAGMPAAVFAVCLLMATPAAQVPAAGLIVGRVVDAFTNRPVSRAIVTLIAPQPATAGDIAVNLPASAPTTAPKVFTDGDGRFLFRNLPAGSYSFTAAAPGYLEGAYGQRRPGGTSQPFSLAENQRVGDVTIRVWKEATLAGQVMDDLGAPIPDIWVTLIDRDRLGARDAAALNRFPQSFNAMTDDRGAFRVAGIPPGDYFVTVPSRMVQWPVAFASLDTAALDSIRANGVRGITPASRAVQIGDIAIQTSSDGLYGGSNILAALLPTTLRSDGSLFAYAQTFYPNVTSIANATVVTLAAGDLRTGIDIHVRPMALTRVSGTVVGPNGPLSGFAVHLIPAFAANQILERTYETAVATTDGKGAFTFLGVPPGPYVLKAWSLPTVLVIGRDAMPPDTTLFGEMAVNVGDAPVTDLTVTVQPGLILSGRVIFDGTSSPPNPAQAQTPLSVAFEPMWPLAFGNRLGVRVNANNEFVTQGLPRGTYVPVLPNQFGLRGWYFESATLKGKDLFIDPIVLEAENVGGIQITFSDKRSELAGVVVDATGKPDPAAVVVVFPADFRAWIQHGLSPLAARTVFASQTGTFSLPMRPGEFLATTISEDALAEWPQAATVEALARTATRVTIARGQSVRVDLKRTGR